MENQNNDDSSHYEVSLTAGQAFIAFVLLLFSLAAAFAFGVIVGKGQLDDVMAADQTAPTSQQARIVELADDDKPREPEREPVSPPVIIEERQLPAFTPATLDPPPLPPERIPHFAQLLSTADAKAAEELATKLIEGGFPSAFVERTQSPRGMVHRVRVTFPSEADARAAVNRLKRFAAGEIWITRQ